MASQEPRVESRAEPLPTLETLSDLRSHTFIQPAKRIHEGNDVSRFLTSLAYRDIGIFILQLNHSLCPRQQANSPIPITFPLTPKAPATPSIQALQALLNKIEEFIKEAPPDPGPRRFGNVSFRSWHGILEERADGLLQEGLLGELWEKAADARLEVKSYLLGSFGSSQRLDYGTGHELSFLAFMGCLWKLGYFKGEDAKACHIEREIVLQVIEPYLRVVRKLIMTYTLEPAGSHGVWGLDDHSFMPYIFGSAQYTRAINDSDPMPQEGSIRGAPKPSDVTKPAIVEEQRHTNMYFSAVGFINDVKKGPFWEHSPMLFDISGIRDGWGKINKGMIKMFNAEVLSKFPVVQHFPFGSLFSWDEDPDASTPTQSIHMANQPPPSTAGTGAPWAQATRMPTTSSGPSIAPARASPGPSSGSLASRQSKSSGSGGGESTGAQITMTKAPWAKD